IVARAISVTVSAPISDISRLLASGDVGAILRSEEPRSTIQEVGALRASMKVLAARIVEYQKELVASAQREAVAEMAAQVAHDIRSPLAALDSALKDIAHIPEEKRSLLRAASGRIRGIAEGLLDKNRAARAGGAPPSALEPLIESVVEEKRLLIPEKVKLSAAGDDGADGIFAAIDPGAFKRVLSNLLNNAIESLNGGGTIDITVKTDARLVRVTVTDDGKGIPPDILARLGERGVSWGKEGGSGLGLSHAKAFAEAHDGRLEITSEIGKGTSAALILPRCPSPSWFVSEIAVAEDGGVLIMDDDPGIHTVWTNRFHAVNAEQAGVVLRHFSEPDELRRWVKAEPELARESVCLFDYELALPSITGLALARELGLLAKMILVTGRAEDPAVISECAAAGVRLLPKSQAARVPLRCVAPSSAPGCVLVDDDELVRKVWAVAAKRAGKRLTVFRTTAECLEAVARLDRGTEIYLDSQLGPEERGEDLAVELHARGFRQIFMATGRDEGALHSLPWLAGVIGKEPPWT
ncbi:MAG: hybrid sensor histidine kinase/response regulator, partial [Elusimicrobiota bacterium]